MDKILKYKSYSRFYNVDQDGYLINESDISYLKSFALDKINYLKDEYIIPRRNDIHSVYIRGSSARKFEEIEKSKSIDNDLDIVIIIKDKNKTQELNESISRFMLDNFDIKIISINDVLDPNSMDGFQHRFILKVLSICIFGEDLRNRIEPFKIKSNIFYGYKYIYNIFNIALLEVKDESIKDVTNLCKWLCKHILRAGLGICIDREEKYTPDLYLCYEVFKKWYPKYEREIKDLLNFYIYPVNDKSVIINIINNMSWMITETNLRILK